VIEIQRVGNEKETKKKGRRKKKRLKLRMRLQMTMKKRKWWMKSINRSEVN